MSILTSRYSSSPESAFDYDIRKIHEHGVSPYLDSIISGELSDAFWEVVLPQEMTTSVASSPYFRLFEAAQVKLNDKGFLSRDISVRELIEVKSDVHHLFPREYLKKQGLNRGQYNQIANYVITQSEINIAIGKKEPKSYFSEILEQCSGGQKRYGNITNITDLNENFEMNCIPPNMEKMSVNEYPSFLDTRRKLMAQKIKLYFRNL